MKTNCNACIQENLLHGLLSQSVFKILIDNALRNIKEKFFVPHSKYDVEECILAAFSDILKNHDFGKN